MKQEMTGFGMIVTALVVLATIAIVGVLGWFGFRFLRDEVLDDGTSQDPEDSAIEQSFIDTCVEQAQRAKGTGQFSYQSWKNIFPVCAQFVTLRIWNSLPTGSQ